MKLNKPTVGKRYGKALFELAVEESKVDEIYQELLTLRMVMKEVPHFQELVSDTRLEVLEKRQLMDVLIQQFDGIMSNFLEVVFEYNRMDSISLIIDEFERRYDDSKGLILGTITTAVSLNEDQKVVIEKKIATMLGYETARLEEKIDPTIIGGVVVEANHQVIDGSVKSRLDYLRTQLGR